LREPAIGPVVTFGVARSESESGLFIVGSLLGLLAKALETQKAA
jgi:hypothetical protein